MIDASDTRIPAASYRWHFWRMAVVIAAVLAAGCSDDQPDRPAGLPSDDECRGSAAALDAERADVDLEYQDRLDEWLALDSERGALDTEWAALKDSTAIPEDSKAAAAESGDSDAADAVKGGLDLRHSLRLRLGPLEAEWGRIEAKLEVFIDAAAEEPAGAEWPLDPRRHSDRWPDLFEHRADLNAEWSDLARSMSDLFEQMSALYRQAAAETPDQNSPQADLADQLSDQFERRSDLYDRYAASTMLWSDHWQAAATWHQQAADLAWNCRYSSV